jgi:hypothetical protein
LFLTQKQSLKNIGSEGHSYRTKTQPVTKGIKVKETKFKTYRIVAVILLLSLFSLSFISPAESTLAISVSISSSGAIALPTSNWLHTSGQNIYYDNGSQVKLYTCVIQDGDGNHIVQSDIQKIKNMGFNVIRLFIEWGTVQPTASSMNTNYFALQTGASSTIGSGVDYIVNWASALGMYTIICPAWTNTWQPPAWATALSGGVGVNSGDSSTRVNLLYNTQIQAGINYMYNWIAQRYATNKYVIFESMNEIGQEPATAADRTAFANYNNGWISAIESGEGANNHIKIAQLLYDGSGYNYALQTPYINGTHSNIIMATHSYPLVDSAASTALSFAQTWSNAIHNAGFPWMDTEHSTALGGTFTPNLAYALSLFNTYNAVGWGYFCYDSNANTERTYNVNNPTDGPQILAVLQPAMIQP